MRSDSEIKAKVVELLGVEGEARSEQIKALDHLDIKALQMASVDSHSVRGMLSALYWTLGYSFADIRQHLVERCLTPSGQTAETALLEQE